MKKQLESRLEKTRKNSFLQTIFSRGLGRTLFFSYLAIALIPFSIVGWFGFQSARESIQQNKFDQLTAVSQLKKDYILSYYSEAIKNVRLEAELTKNKEFITRLRDAMKESKLAIGEFVKDLRWNLLIEAFAPDLKRSLLRYNFNNIYLIDPEGNLLYSVQQNDDLGTNLLTGRFASSKFAAAVRSATEKSDPVYSDLEINEASGNQVAGFVVQAMFDDKSQIIGVLAAQISTQPVNAILQDTTGLGETGETYLVGTDLLMRSESRFSEESAVLKVNVDTEATRQWTQKIQGTQPAKDLVSYQGYRGSSVLGVYQTIEIGDVKMALMAEIDEAEAFYPVAVLGNLVGILFTTTGIMVILLSFYVTVRVVAPLRSLTRWARRIAQGELNVKEIITPKNEIGDLSKSFQEVVKSFQEVTNVCQAVSVGDYTQSVELRSQNDILAQSINQMANTLRAVVKQANIIAEGDYSLEILPKSAKDQLAIALANMTHRLKTISAENERQQWFKTGQAELSDRLRGEQNLEQLGDHVIRFLCTYLKADIGGIYFRENNDNLRLVATYAFTIANATQSTFQLGEGLIGQVALQQKSLITAQVPEDLPLIRSSIIKSAPKQLLIYPLVYEENTIGVLELGKLVNFSEDEINFIELMAESVAIAFASNQARLILSEMLDQSQQQADALERQQRALKKANEDLEQKTKELVTANQYKSDFLARMSHELRTPLNSILILSKTLIENKQKNLNDKQIEHSKVIYSAGSDLLMLINDILDLAKVEAGRMEILIDKVGLQALADYMQSSFTPIAEDRKLKFFTSIAPDVPQIIFTDRQRLEQILRNLISNAFKFTAKGSVDVKIVTSDKKLSSLQNKTATGQVICFQVKDTGCGIPKEKQEIIFEAFRQADSSTSRKYGGTGLGLNISKELANALGGILEVTSSEEGNGSTFSLYLPEKLLPSDSQAIIETKNLTEERRETQIQVIESSTKQIEEKPLISVCCKDKTTLDLISAIDSISMQSFASLQDCLAAMQTQSFAGIIIAAEMVDKKQMGPLKELMNGDVPIAMVGKAPKLMGNEFSSIIKIEPNDNENITQAITQLINTWILADKTEASEAETKENEEEGSVERLKEIVHHSKFIDKEVLIVDDDMRNIYALNSLLEDHGINVIVATSGKECLDLLHTNEDIDLVFMDIMMPEMNGVDVIKAIRKDDDYQSLPIIALTARVTPEDEKQCINAGANAYLTKPLDSSKLKTVLKKWLN